MGAGVGGGGSGEGGVLFEVSQGEMGETGMSRRKGGEPGVAEGGRGLGYERRAQRG